MARVKLNVPFDKPIFTTQIPLRISDMNYGNHLGNDALLSILHDARMQFLVQAGYTELDIGGPGLIMADVMIAYRGEAFFGDTLTVTLFVSGLGSRSFDLMYRVMASRKGADILIAEAKTGMVCMHYENRKITELPAAFRTLLQA